MDQFARTELLLGKRAMARLRNARVAVFGLGGVGGSAAEALARSGVGSLDLIDSDRVSLTNLNRQAVATHSSLGQYKADAMEAQLKAIFPQVRIVKHILFYLPEGADAVDLTAYDYVIDAIDTVTAKLELITRADRLGVPLISAMGAGNRLDPSQLRIGDLYETSVCRLARVMRREARRRGIRHLTVAYSTEEPIPVDRERAARLLQDRDPTAATRRDIPGSAAFVPPAMGLLIASRVVRDLIQTEKKTNERGDENEIAVSPHP